MRCVRWSWFLFGCGCSAGISAFFCSLRRCIREALFRGDGIVLRGGVGAVGGVVVGAGWFASHFALASACLSLVDRALGFVRAAGFFLFRSLGFFGL